MLQGQESNRLNLNSYAFRPIPNHHQKLPTNRQFRTRSYKMLHNNYTTDNTVVDPLVPEWVGRQM